MKAMEQLNEVIKKLQRVHGALVKLIACIEEPEINQDYEIELLKAEIQELQQAIKDTK